MTKNDEKNGNNDSKIVSSNQRKRSAIDFPTLIKTSESFQKLKQEIIVGCKLSLTGISNLVVNYEDPCIVDEFLEHCFKKQELYNNTIHIDAVELQQSQPGRMKGYDFLDQLIYGTFETEVDKDLDIEVPQIDYSTGKRKRNMDGFVNRKKLLVGNCKDKLLIVRNIDYSLDFCDADDPPGVISPRALNIFDNFRNPNTKLGCKILLVTNEKVKLPFQIRHFHMSPVDEFEANHIIDSFMDLYENSGYDIKFTNSQREQISRKISGLNYTEAGDVLALSISSSETEPKSKKIDGENVIKVLRKAINEKFMEKGFGLVQLTPRPWEDYICPESSNFTWDVKKLLRDFKEVKYLQDKIEECIKKEEDESEYVDLMERIQGRMPHVIILYGKGGTGKSAFAVHLAGLLGFDAWDFNVNATHSKWVGQGSEQARKSIQSIMNSSHVIVRIDEYDRAIGATNDSSHGMHEAHKQVESEFMSWLQNGQEENEFMKKNIFVVLTTNHKDTITGPMLRSGRADLVIDIDNFDSESMKETLKTTARRMKNRGVKVVGFDSHEKLQKAIDDLDLDSISQLCTLKGFTVRDVETLVIEMAAHAYYFEKGEEGLPWCTKSFVDVLEHSEGTMKEDDSTGELIIGDRELFKLKGRKDKQEQCKFEFDNKKEKRGFVECK